MRKIRPICVIIYFQTALAIILARRWALSDLDIQRFYVICLDASREGYGLLEHYRNNLPGNVYITYLSRKEAAKQFGIAQTENSLEFIKEILAKGKAEDHFILDEIPIYSSFHIDRSKGKRSFSYNWSSLVENVLPTATLCLQGILYNKTDPDLAGGSISITPPTGAHHIKLSRQYRSTRAIYGAVAAVLEAGETQALHVQVICSTSPWN